MTQSTQRKQSLLLVNQHYHPDVAASAQYTQDLAEYLVQAGYSVEVLCGRGHYVAGQLAVPLRDSLNGVSIRRVRTTWFGRGSHLGRVLDYASYYCQVFTELLFGRKRDGVIVLTTPPLLCFIGAIARFARGQRYAVWSMDMHPDAEIESGMLRRDGIAARLLTWINAVGYRHADLVVDLGAFMKRRITRMGVPEERTRTVHVWSDRVVPVERDANPLRDELGLRDKFVVMYSGNAGLVHDFDAILEAMRRLSDDPSIHFLFVGAGPRRAEIERYALEHGLTNFEYRGYFPREKVRWSLGVADVHLISLRKPFVGVSVPAKLYGIMAAARPALFVGPRECESAQTILSAGCGEVVDPDGDDPAGEIVDLIRRWRTNPELMQTLGKSGRAAFVEEYDRVPCCNAWVDALRETWPTFAESTHSLGELASSTA